MNIPFTKMHGLGNDFILIEEDQLDPEMELPDLARVLCDRHFGIGADGLIIIAPPDNVECEIQFKFFNSDGSRPEMCGNGIRCFARYVKDQGMIKRPEFKVETLAGVLIPHVHPDGTVTVDMGAPILAPEKIPFTGSTQTPALNVPISLSDGQSVTLTPISMGNPHAILFLPHLPAEKDWHELGAEIETHAAFPAKTNVEFAHVQDKHTVELVVWERSEGPTLACGTGACATAVAGILTGVLQSPVTVNLPGGPLHIEWRGETSHVMMTGPASYVFAGMVPYDN